MRDRDDRALVALQVTFEPGHRVGVEVIGRFVEQEDVRLHQQQAAERDAAFLSAGERGDHRFAGRATQGFHRHLDAGVEVPAAARVEDRLDLALAGQDLLLLLRVVGLRDLHERLVIFFEERLHRPRGLHHACLDREVFVEARFLGEVAERVAGDLADRAVEFLVLAGHDLEQRGLARAVEAEDADLGPIVIGKGNITENGFLFEVLRDPRHREDYFFVGHGGRFREDPRGASGTLRPAGLTALDIPWGVPKVGLSSPLPRWVLPDPLFLSPNHFTENPHPSP